MNEFEIDGPARRHRPADVAPAGISLDGEDIARHVARAHQLRGEQIRTWAKITVRTIASLWSGPGRAIPADYVPVDMCRAARP